MTDLTGSLANFNIYATVGRMKVIGDKYYNYDQKNKTKTFCMGPKIGITHLYVYVKDNYSFNNSDGNDQYLGHWNKIGLVTTSGGIVDELVNGKYIHVHAGDSPTTTTTYHCDYLFKNPLDKPIDSRPGFGKFKEENVYYPVFNSTYSKWSEKHNRGGDFMIYSKPQLIELKKPIMLAIGTVCRPSEKM